MRAPENRRDNQDMQSWHDKGIEGEAGEECREGLHTPDAAERQNVSSSVLRGAGVSSGHFFALFGCGVGGEPWKR